LIFTEFLTGAPPPFDAPTFHEPAVAVRSGVTLTIPRAGVLPQLADLVDQMLAADPYHRPTIARVHETLMSIRPATEPPRRPVTTGALRGKGLRGTGVSSTAPTPPPAPTPSPAPKRTSAPTPAAAPAPAVPSARPTGRLVGKLLSKLTERGRP
jgi:hypothetical protein